MRTALLIAALSAVASCVLDADLGEKECNGAHACVAGFACVQGRCVVVVGEGEGEGALGEGEGVAGEGEGVAGEGEGATSGEGEGAAEGEGVAGEGEGATSGEGEGTAGEGEGAASGEGEGAASGEGEGAASGEGEGAAGEGEGAAGEGEGAAGEGEGAAGEGEGAAGEGEGAPPDGTCLLPFPLSTTTTNSGDTTNAPANDDGSCSGGTDGEQIWSLPTATSNEDIAIDLSVPPASSFDAVLYARTVCGDGSSELNCVDDTNPPDGEHLAIEVAQGETPFVYVDGYVNGGSGAYSLDATVTPQVCGDDLLSPRFEECEDGNTVPTDTCDAQCNFNFDRVEVEPNDNGSHTTTGGCFTPSDEGAQGVNNAAANFAPITTDTRVLGNIDPAGDEDAFPIRNTTSSAVNVLLHVHGRLDPCDFRKTDISMDTYLFMLAANGQPLKDSNNNVVEDDDIDTSTCGSPAGQCDECSALVVTIPANTTVFAVVGECGDDTPIEPYVLEVDFP